MRCFTIHFIHSTFFLKNKYKIFCMSWIATDYFSHFSEQCAKHWSNFRADGKLKIAANIRSLHQCLCSRGRKQKKSSAPRTSEARDMQAHRSALKQATSGTEMKVNLGTCKNVSFEWGLYFFSICAIITKPSIQMLHCLLNKWSVNKYHSQSYFGVLMGLDNEETRLPENADISPGV